MSISHRWGDIICSVGFVIGGMVCISWGIDAGLVGKYDPKTWLGIGPILLVFSLVSYDITEQYLVTKYCGIPVFRTPWHKISHVVYLPQMTPKRKDSRQACVILSKVSGKPYLPEKNVENLRRNIFTTIRINLYDSEIEPCIQALEQCVGVVHRLDND